MELRINKQATIGIWFSVGLWVNVQFHRCLRMLSIYHFSKIYFYLYFFRKNILNNSLKEDDYSSMDREQFENLWNSNGSIFLRSNICFFCLLFIKINGNMI